jgi:hypothetical protein
VTGTLVGSLYYIVATLFYYDLRVRKEAFDLEERIGPEGRDGLDESSEVGESSE